MKVIWNTFYLNVLFIFAGLLFSLTIAIVLSEINGRYFKKVTQSVVILPHFISWSVVAMFSTALLSSDTGLINSVLEGLGREPIKFYSEAGVWPAILAILRIWHGAGFGSIVYLAAIMGIDQEIYEAAEIDGASRVRRIFSITLPLLKNTVILLLILNVGKIFNGDFGLIYAMVGNNTLLYPTTDIIDTYVYRALMELGDMGMSSAVGLAQSVVGFIFVLLTNAIAKRASSESALF
ncbi:putative multiple-sugar transport system permease YteP [compost metagenome]